MSWQTDEGAREELDHDHRGERRLLVFMVIALVAVAVVVIARAIYLGWPA
jgi:hypothetical protein